MLTSKVSSFDKFRVISRNLILAFATERLRFQSLSRFRNRENDEGKTLLHRVQSGN